MTKEEKKELIEAIAEAKSNKTDQAKYIDWLFKALIAVLVWLGSEMRSDVTNLKETVGKMATQREYSERDMESFRKFIEEPRFTKQNFETEILPLKNQVNTNTGELNARSTFMEKTSQDIIELKYKISDIEENIKRHHN